MPKIIKERRHQGPRVSSVDIVVPILPSCDICKSNGYRGIQASYDSRMPNGTWVYLCTRHYREYGIGLGLGKGHHLLSAEPACMDDHGN